MADVTTLHKAFRKLSKVLHPDTTVLPVEEAARKFQQVCEAYELLSDPIRRKLYDDNLLETTMQKTSYEKEDFALSETLYKTVRAQEVRRPFSGGELFSLFLLGVALFISLLLALGFAFVNGKELQARPSWLIVNSISPNKTTSSHTYVRSPRSQYSTQSTFIRSPRILVE